MITITELVCTCHTFRKQEELTLIALICVDSVMVNNAILEDLICSAIFPCCTYKTLFNQNVEAEINKKKLRTRYKHSSGWKPIKKIFNGEFCINNGFLIAWHTSRFVKISSSYS